MKQKWLWLTCTLAGISWLTPGLTLENSVGTQGINALKLHQEPYNLLGRKIALGQVEIGRPGRFGWDKILSRYSALNLSGLFYRDRQAEPNLYLDNHANMVATIMVSQDKRFRGVAPEARLYAAAVGNIAKGGQAEECLASQHLNQQNGGDLRAINFSFGESLLDDPREEPKLDGNALLTQCIDWSARVHDVLYVIAGNQGQGGIPIPTDHYNGITSAYTAMRQGEFNKVDFANLSSIPEGIGRTLIQKEINAGNRRAVSLLAPGHQIPLYSLQGEVTPVTGTSFAAPHITGTVALLQEYGDRILTQTRQDWSIDSRRHQVSKAVLLNSANKVEGILGMDRTILNKTNQTWLEGDAYRDWAIPLDIEMGTGQLEAWRALQQFEAGQGSPETPASPKGWDYEEVEVNDYQDYYLEKPLAQDTYVSVTLTWDRLVELKDINGNDEYNPGESFRDRGLNNLDLYVLPADSNNQEDAVCGSLSQTDSVEHIFCPIPVTGRYKIRVYYRRQINEPVQTYGLAWWTEPLISGEHTHGLD